MLQSYKYTFSGHDSFQCRLLWLKKGYDYLREGRTFSADDAPVILGVGNNMVRAIKHWLRAFGLLDEATDQPTQLADLLFGYHDEGAPFDAFLEDNATLWLLHYQLVRTRFASTYWLIFDEFRKRKIEFTREDYGRFIEQKGREESFTVSPKSISEDFGVFLKMYYRGTSERGTKVKDREDSFSGILTELDLVHSFPRKNEDGKSEISVYVITPSDRDDVPADWILYCLLDSPSIGMSVNLETLENDPGMPCAVFGMNRAGLLRKIEQLVSSHEFLTYNDQAGVRELQFREKPADKYQILRNYYASVHV
ncbi:DUF4007 family protein [Hymenobacter negativus]|uniref:DUF4007 family protein n=1 Tax=Hymenobacter negativus TaxID=2795026 RepID=A0ABS0QDY2_9BACT|nr:DUF4007 family protein [Hymenobacter negativus]MBH8560396.1 DUF4007 family protein [Hymenobacter negativus]